MTENKRFTDDGIEEIENQSFTDNLTEKTYRIDNGLDDIVELINELNDENEFSKKRIASLNNMVLHGLSKDNVDEVIYQKYVKYTNFYDDLTRSEKMLVANFSDFLTENLFESLKKMEL